jgi:hypothetical protein
LKLTIGRIFGEKCIPAQIPLEKEATDPLLVRDVRNMNREESIFGGYVEEVIVCHGEYEEIFAIDNEGQKSKREIIRENRYKKRGFPPLSPLSNVKENIYSDLFDIIWKEIVPKMFPVLIRMQELGDAIAEEDREDRINQAKHKKILMRPSKTLKNQNIEYGLDHAVQVRSFITNKTDQPSDHDSYSKQHYEQFLDTDRSHYGHERSDSHDSVVDMLSEEEIYDSRRGKEFSNMIPPKRKYSIIPPSSQESLLSGLNSNVTSPRGNSPSRKTIMPRSGYSSQFPVRQHSKNTISGGFKFNNEPPQRKKKEKMIPRMLPVIINNVDAKNETSQAWKRPPKISKATPSTSHGRPQYGPPSLASKFAQPHPKMPDILNSSRFPSLESKQQEYPDNRAQSAIPGSFNLTSLFGSRPSSQHNKMHDEDTCFETASFAEEQDYKRLLAHQRKFLFSSPNFQQDHLTNRISVKGVEKQVFEKKKKHNSSDSTPNLFKDFSTMWENTNFSPDHGSTEWCTTTIRE